MSFAVSALVLLLCAPALSQTTPTIDHLAVHVHDLEKSAQFYEKVMGFSRIPDPFNDGTHVWFRVGEHQQLHVVSGAAAASPSSHDIRVHMAFRVASVADFRKRLEAMKVPYRGIRDEPGHMSLRPDGVKQIYFQDPDGYWIEVDDDRF